MADRATSPGTKMETLPSRLCSSSSMTASSGDDDGAAPGHLLGGGSAQGHRASRRPLPLRGDEERERRGGEGEKERR